MDIVLYAEERTSFFVPQYPPHKLGELPWSYVSSISDRMYD